MEESPSPINRHLGVAHFTLYRAERFHHNLLPLALSSFDALSVVASRRDDGILSLVRLRVADKYYGKHINLFGVELCQRGAYNMFSRATGFSHIPYRCGRSTPLQKERFEPMELPIPPLALGVVDCGNEVRLGSCYDAFLYLLPRGHEVGEGDNAEVVPDGSTQERSRFLEGTDTGEDLDLYRTIPIFFHLIDEGSHAVDAGIARTDHRNALPLLRLFEGNTGTLSLFFHPGVDTTSRGGEPGFNELEIVFIAYYYVALGNGFAHRRGDVLRAAGAYACDYDTAFVHN